MGSFRRQKFRWWIKYRILCQKSMIRWTKEEELGLEAIRFRLKDELASIDQHPDSLGGIIALALIEFIIFATHLKRIYLDRKLLRFFRGHSHDLDVSCTMISKVKAPDL